MKKLDKRFVAVIDIGSNSIKMSMARLNHETKIILEDKLPLRLLEKSEKKISRKNIDNLNRAMKRFMSRTKKYAPIYRVIATSAMRRALNRKEVIAMMYKKWGLRVQVISGLTEAKYVVHAVESKFDLRRGKYCIVDIGGGSMELIQMVDGKTKWMKSVPFGSVVVKEKFCATRARDIFDMGIVVGNIEQAILKSIPKPMEGILLLSGGTPSTIARIFQKDRKWKDIHGRVILMKDLEKLFDPILHKPIDFWTKRYKINPHRRDILFACMATVIALMRIMELDYFQLSKTGLRQGILAEVLQQYA